MIPFGRVSEFEDGRRVGSAVKDEERFVVLFVEEDFEIRDRLDGQNDSVEDLPS